MSERQSFLRGLPVFCVLPLVVIIGFGWYLYSNISARVVSTLSNSSQLNIDIESAHYDLFSRKLTLEGIVLSRQGLEVRAPSANIELQYNNWFDVWLSRKPKSFGDISFYQADISITSKQIDPLNITTDQAITFDGGTVQLVGFEPVIRFSEVILLPIAAEGFNISARGAGNNPWQFSGQLIAGELPMSGQLEVSEQPLASLLATDSAVSGTYDASLSVEFSRDYGLLLEGTIEGGEGFYENQGTLLSWRQWQLEDFQLVSDEPGKPEVSLFLSGASLELSRQADDRVVLFVANLLQSLPILPSVVNAADGQIRSEESSWLLRNLYLNLKETDDSLLYRLNGELQSGGLTSITGSIARNESVTSSYQLQLRNVVLDDSWRNYTSVDGYDLTDSIFSLDYSSDNKNGALSVERWRYESKADLHGVSLSDVQRLITSNKGKANTTFQLKQSPPAAEFVSSVQTAVLSQWQQIARNESEYLQSLMEDRLNPVLLFCRGESSLSTDALKSLRVYANVLQVRPAVRLRVVVGVSEKTDWEILAQQELNQSLSQLYGVLNPASNGIPEETRSELVEQVYLSTREDKIPEVGVQAVDERRSSAEQWLVRNWPKNPMLLQKLQQQRIKEIRKQLLAIGLSAQQFEVKASGKDMAEAEVQFR